MKKPGIITEQHKKRCMVDTGSAVVEASTKGILHRRDRPYAGDRVDVELDESGTQAPRIATIHPRRTLLHRPAIANVDQMILVCTIKAPQLDLLTIDRCLFSAEVNDISSIMVWNKVDLLDEQERQELEQVRRDYGEIGYDSLEVCAAQGKGVDAVVNSCREKISCVAGLSGVGKSTLLSRIFPDREFRVAEVSSGSMRGTHTTTTTTLLSLPGGGYLADTPGFSMIDVPTVPPESVIASFPDLVPYIGQCRYADCTHRTEPGCAVQEMVDQGRIKPWRHEHFIEFYEEMKQRNRTFRPGRGKPYRREEEEEDWGKDPEE